MRDFRLFAIRDDEDEPELEVSAIHDDSGYRALRESLSRQYDLNHREPNIQVWSVNLRGDRSLTLRHTQHHNRPLHDSAQEVLKHVARLWGFDVHLDSVDDQGRVTKSHRAGFTTDGTPANLHVVRSMRGALARRIALSGDTRREIRQLEARLEHLKSHPHAGEALIRKEIRDTEAALEE